MKLVTRFVAFLSLLLSFHSITQAQSISLSKEDLTVLLRSIQGRTFSGWKTQSAGQSAATDERRSH